MSAWPPFVIHNNGAITTPIPRLTPMQRLRGIVLGGIRAGHSKDSIIDDLRHSRIRVTDPHVLAYIDGVFDTIEELGVKC